jgi:hypothetical protein
MNKEKGDVDDYLVQQGRGYREVKTQVKIQKEIK